MIPLRAGSGVWLEDFTGKRYIDGISSWWVNLFGHANPRISAAVAEQLGRLEHVIFAGFTHEPAVTLAEELVRLAPRRPQSLLLRGQRLRRDRSRGEDELPFLAQHRPYAQDAFHHARQQLPRRDARRARGRQCRPVQIHLQAAADGCHHRASPDAYPREPGTSEAEPFARMFAQMESTLAAHHARRRRRHRRAAGAMRGRHAHVRPGLPDSCCARPATSTACT